MKRAYIQQITYNGGTYEKGTFSDLYKDFGIGVESFPFKVMPEAKDVAKVDWPDEHGVDAYTPPGGLYMKNYDMDVDIIFHGDARDIRDNIERFLAFVAGRNDGGSARLAIYDEHVMIGRKDVRYLSNQDNLWWNEDCDDNAIARLTVKFHVDDPVTNIAPVYDSDNNVTGLSW